MNNFKVIDFRFACNDEKFDNKFATPSIWSRPYEYKYVTDFIEENSNKNNIEIHNSSWGFEGVHVIFRDYLDKLGNCVHSDISNSDFKPTYYYDITEEKPEFENKFDFVLNISTIEHIESETNRIKAIENLFKQVKNGGYLILTFDYPRVNLDEIEKLVGVKPIKNGVILNGENSNNQNIRYKDLNIIYLILKKK